MICPKCGFEQPETLECMRCGVIISRYRGPVAETAVPELPLSSGSSGEVRPPAPPPPLPPPPPASSEGGTVYAGPPGGTIYAGPAPGAVDVGRTLPSLRGYHGTFDLGQVLGQTFSIYFSNFIAFFLLTAVAMSPLLLFSAYVSTLDAQSSLAQFSSLVAPLLNLLTAPIATAAVTFGVFQQMRGRDASIGDCLQVGFSSLFSVLGVAIVQGIGVGLGMLACIIPGVILWTRWAVSVPAAMEEKPGVGGALDRSAYLTEGFRWHVFGVLIIISIINAIVGSVLTIGLGAVAVAGTGGNPSGIILLLTNLAQVVTTGLQATAAAVMYYRLRSVKESIDVDQIASVFA